jgi:hypothetical protein
MITKEIYFKGQDHHESVEASADELITRVNRLMVYVSKDLPEFKVEVSSGYRSPTHNAKVGGATQSNHMAGRAVDIRDPKRDLARWCVQNKERLVEQMLWCEDPRATKGWVHLQSSPPRSGLRFFIPSLAAVELCRGPLTMESLS